MGSTEGGWFRLNQPLGELLSSVFEEKKNE